MSDNLCDKNKQVTALRKKSGDFSKDHHKIFNRIAFASINSVPGMLLLMKFISDFPFYHVLLLDFGVLEIVARVLDITDKPELN